MSAPVIHADGLKRCPWPKQDPLYIAYHDEEWGVPEWDDRALYEKLVLDGFQAGLSWITILRKRDNFRRAFNDFAPEKIARYTPKKIERLMQDAGIVRNRAKIEGAVGSARGYLEIMDSGPGFSEMLWKHVGGKPIDHKIGARSRTPTETAESRAMSKELLDRVDGIEEKTREAVSSLADAVTRITDRLQRAERKGETITHVLERSVSEIDERVARIGSGGGNLEEVHRIQSQFQKRLDALAEDLSQLRGKLGLN